MSSIYKKYQQVQAKIRGLNKKIQELEKEISEIEKQKEKLFDEIEGLKEDWCKCVQCINKIHRGICKSSCMQLCERCSLKPERKEDIPSFFDIKQDRFERLMEEDS